MDMEEIYTQVILEHSSSKKNKKNLEKPTISKKGLNPSCGDQINLELVVENNKIVDAAFTGVGCAISQASTSIMIDQIKGMSIDEAKKAIDSFIKLIRKEELTENERGLLGDAQALENISNMPARVKCATLSWYTLRDVLE